MCYGLDPKYQMRDIEARVKTYGFEQQTHPAPDAAPGLMVWLRGVIAWLMRKDARHV